MINHLHLLVHSHINLFSFPHIATKWVIPRAYSWLWEVDRYSAFPKLAHAYRERSELPCQTQIAKEMFKQKYGHFYLQIWRHMNGNSWLNENKLSFWWETPHWLLRATQACCLQHVYPVGGHVVCMHKWRPYKSKWN